MPIHVLEFWTNSMGLEAVWLRDSSHQFVVEYTDNSAAEVIADSQHSSSLLMTMIASWRSDFMDSSGMCVLPQRVSSAENVWADWLSRGQLWAVLREAAQLGLQPRFFPVPPRAGSLLVDLTLAHVS